MFSALVTYKHIVSVMQKLGMWDPELGAAASPWAARSRDAAPALAT